MEGKLRWVLLTAVAPIAWGANYYVIHRFLPGTDPLWGAVLRALPAGLLLLALARRLPRGAWWWRSAVLGVLNVGAFFLLIHLAAQLLPSSVAAVVMATAPVVMMLLAWALVAERPGGARLASAGLGILGVAVMLLGAAGPLNLGGIVASVAAMVMSSLGFVLAKRWTAGGGVDVLSGTAWQLIAGGLLVLPFAVLVGGPPPVLTADTAIGFGYVTVVATALAFVCWFTGLRRLAAGQVGLVGLLNPVTGVLLGTALAGESMTVRQLIGMGLVLAGVLLGQRVAAPKSAAAPSAPGASGTVASGVVASGVVASGAVPSGAAAQPGGAQGQRVADRGRQDRIGGVAVDLPHLIGDRDDVATVADLGDDVRGTAVGGPPQVTGSQVTDVVQGLGVPAARRGVRPVLEHCSGIAQGQTHVAFSKRSVRRPSSVGRKKSMRMNAGNAGRQSGENPQPVGHPCRCSASHDATDRLAGLSKPLTCADIDDGTDGRRCGRV